MQDADLAVLIGRTGGRFPNEAYDEFDGVDPVWVDMTIMGIASHYTHNSREVSAEHREMLVHELSDLDRMYELLPTDTARAYFDRTRAVGRYLLDRRGPTQKRVELR
jgi:hypothetical protein